MVAAFAVVMSAAGIDLSAFALFSGAIGVGLGFGLQKIVANFISGVILLADKSVKPGDLITIGDSSGKISAMNTRYISVAAGDGREILIDLARRVHLRDIRREQQAFLGELRAPAVLRQHNPVLFASRIAVMAAGGQAGFDDLRSVFDKRSHDVADEFGTLKEAGQRFDSVCDLDDLIIRGLDSRNLLDDSLNSRLVAPGGDKGNVVFPQILTHQAPGVAGDAIYDDRSFRCHDGCFLDLPFVKFNSACRHMPIPPSTGSPAPVMKRAASEHRKTVASAMSGISPRRPSGV